MRVLTASLLALAAPVVASAQLTPTVAGNGMGGAYIALARGHEALWVNPANLALGGNPSLSIGITPVGAQASVLGLDLQQVQDLVKGGASFDAATKSQILAKIPASGTRMAARFFSPVLVAQMGHFAVGLGVGAQLDYTLGKDLVDLALNGYNQNRVDYQTGATRGRQAWYLDAALGYGRSFGPLKLGVTGHYIVPRGLDNFRMYEPTYDLVNRQIGISAFTAGTSGGSGFSLDAGGAMELGPLTISAMVENVAGNVKWGEEINYRSISLNNNNVGDAGKVISDAFRNDPTPLNPTTAPLGAIQTAQGLYDKAYLPTVLHAGAVFRLPGLRTRISGQYNNTMREGFMNAPWKKSVAVGVAQPLFIFTPSVGYATDLEDGTLMTAGLGLGPINVAVGKLVDGKIGGVNREGVTASFGITLGF